jgi:hypothetical protein
VILLEILIGLSLTAILLTFLFSFFVESARIEKKLDTARMAINARNHLQIRLQTLFTSIDREGSDSFFYTKQLEKEPSNSLIIRFNNGIDPSPLFSGAILGRLYIDSKKNLSLACWPLEKNKPKSWRKEVLLSNVESFEFEFLGPITASEHGKKEEIRPITAAYGWRTAWPKNLCAVPSLIRLNIQQQKGKDPLHFAFILPSNDPPVIYTEKKAI